MAINDLRTKITDLPLCEDIDSLETMIGVGADGKMYRVDKNSIAGGGKWISLSGAVAPNGKIGVNNADILNAINTGGKIHVVVYSAESGTIDLSFLIAESYINNGSSEGRNVAEASAYDSSSSTHLTKSLYFFDTGALVVGLLYDGTDYFIDFSSLSVDVFQYFQVIGVFFEPIKNIGDLRITDGGATPS